MIKGDAGSGVGAGVHVHSGPPKVLIQEGKGAVRNRMAGEIRCVTPLEDLRMDGVWDKEELLPRSGWVYWDDSV